MLVKVIPPFLNEKSTRLFGCKRVDITGVAVVSFVQNKCIRGETMARINYEIPMLSARGIISYAEKRDEEKYIFNLNSSATAKCLMNKENTLQEDCAMFYQLKKEFHNYLYRLILVVQFLY